MLERLVLMLFPWLVTEAGYTQEVVRMITHNTAENLRPGQSVELECEFYMDRFNLFQNPIVWSKVQLDEVTPMNIQGNVMSPFVETGRFGIKFHMSEPQYKIVLTIKGLVVEDYGNYTCEVRGPQTSVLASLTHYVFVRAPVHSISVSDTTRTIHLSDMDRVLTFTETDPASLFCKSAGGCPPPQMSIYIGENDVTQQFTSVTYSRFSGHKGLRAIEHVTESWSENFNMNPDYDDKILQCVVTVPSLGSNMATVRINVTYAPIIECEQTHASIGQTHINLVCEVRARPSVLVLYWDSNHTRLQEHVSNTARSDGKLETRLHIKKVTIHSFRTYTVVAENSIGTTTHEIKLSQKHQYSSHQSVLQNPTGNTSYSPSGIYSASTCLSYKPHTLGTCLLTFYLILSYLRPR